MTIESGTKGSLSFTKATGDNKEAITINGGEEQKGTSYTLTGKEGTTITIKGSLATLNVNLKVIGVAVTDASDLTSLTFSSTAGSNISDKFSFSVTNGKLATLTADNCGLTSLPTGLKDALADKATVSLKNNKITTVSDLKDAKDITYNFDGNKITSWPELEYASITYGSQSSAEIKPASKPIANEWFDVWTSVAKEKYTNTKVTAASQLNYAWRKGTSGSFSTSLIKKSDTYAGNFQFYSNNEYQSGTYQCQVSPKTAGNGPTYVVTVNVDPAKFTLKYYENTKEATSEGGDKNGHFNIYKQSGTTPIISGTENNVSKGDKLVLNAKAATKSGYVFSKYELKGLKATTTENVYEVVGEGEAKELSAVAVFTKNTYKLTIDADTEHGHHSVINNTDNKEVSNGAILPYGTKLTVKATPEEGYTPRVILNKAESTKPNPDEKGVYTFTQDLTITTTSTLQILFDKTKEYALKVQCLVGYNLKLNGTNYVKATDGDNKGYYVNNTTKYLPKFAAGTMITLEMVKTSDATASIKKVLLNAKEIGTSARVQFEMPTGTEIGETAAIVTFETSTLASLTGKVTSKTGEDTQTFTYDGNAHPFEYVVNPSGLTGFTVKYTKEGQAENYTTTAPTAVGTYKVLITRKADASYAEFNSRTGKTEDATFKDFKVTISKATPTITTAPTVTVTTDGDYSISGGKAQVGGKDVAGEWTVIDTENGNKAITKCSKTISHLATVAFLPTDKSNLNGSKNASDIVSNAATVQVAVKIGDTALSTYKVTATNIPSDMSLTFWNGANEVKSGSSVPAGTTLTIKLTYPAGYTDVTVKENKANGYTIAAGVENKAEGTKIVSEALDVTVSFKGNAEIVTLEIVKKAMTNKVEYDYAGNIQINDLFTADKFDFKNAKTEDVNELQKQMTITYKDAKGNKVVAPVNAGEYTVVVTIPEVKTDNATYKAVTQEFEKLYIINKAKPEVSVWPKDAVVGIGKDAKTAQFIGGSADVEGTFHFIEEDKIGVPETGDEYEVKFVPADATNYAEVLSTNKAKIVVTDQRTLFISDVANGSIKVTDQNGNELKDEQILDSKITSIKVTATPNSGYVLGTLTVNNSSLSNGGSYTLGSDNVVVSATFVKQYTITLGSAPKGVKIATKPSSNVVVAGGSYTFTLNHVSGDKPTVTGASNISVSTSGSTTTVKVTNIQANATLAIALANPTAIKITTKPTLSKAGKPMGTIRVSGVNSSNECYYGDKITVTATANPGVEFSGWEDMTSTENPYEFEATKATYTFQAKYHGVLTGIESVDELNYYGGDGYIFVNCPAQGTLTIISMNGRTQKMSVSGQTRVTVPAGVYGIVLTSGSEVVRDKVVVR